MHMDDPSVELNDRCGRESMHMDDPSVELNHRCLQRFFAEATEALTPAEFSEFSLPYHLWGELSGDNGDVQ